MRHGRCFPRCVLNVGLQLVGCLLKALVHSAYARCPPDLKNPLQLPRLPCATLCWSHPMHHPLPHGIAHAMQLGWPAGEAANR